MLIPRQTIRSLTKSIPIRTQPALPLASARRAGATQWLPTAASTTCPRCSFSTSQLLSKKGGKHNREQAQTEPRPTAQGGEPIAPTPVDEAFDFSGLESSILKALEKLTHDLSQLRAGGRFNPELLEALRVQLDKTNPRDTERLSDVAQVVPRGRNISIIVHDKEHVKQVMSAIANSPHSLVPQGPTQDAPTTISLLVPPPTTESRQAAVASANKSAEEAQNRIRGARQAHQRKIRALDVAKRIRPDDTQKAHKQMEEVVKKGNEEVKRILDGAKRVLEH